MSDLVFGYHRMIYQNPHQRVGLTTTARLHEKPYYVYLVFDCETMKALVVVEFVRQFELMQPLLKFTYIPQQVPQLN